MNDLHGTANVPPPPHNAATRPTNNHNATNPKRPPLQRGGVATSSFQGGAAVGSLRDLLESLRFDMDDANHRGVRGNDAPGDGGADDAADDAGGPRARQRRMPGTVPEEDDDDDEGSHGVFGETDSEDEADVRYGGSGGHAAETEGRFRHSSPGDDEQSFDSTEYVRGFDVDEDEDDPRHARNRRHRPPRRDGRYDDRDFDDDDDDDDLDLDDDDDELESLKSYEDAGYDNEEDYLFDQYGGIGGTAEERAELAEALMHTLNVGPMADDLFYEEVAMCFLRCRERHRMRTRREEQRERKRRMRREAVRRKKGMQRGGGGPASGASSGGEEGLGARTTEESEEDVSERMAKMRMRDRGRDQQPVDSEYEHFDGVDDDDDEDDDDDSVAMSRLSENMRNVNVESDYEDVRQSRRRKSKKRTPGAASGMPGDGDDDEDDISIPSSPMSSTDHDDDDSFLDGPRKDKATAPSADDHESSMFGMNYDDTNHRSDFDDAEGHFEYAKSKRRSEADGEQHDNDHDASYPNHHSAPMPAKNVPEDVDDGPAYGAAPPHSQPPKVHDNIDEPVFRVDLEGGTSASDKNNAKTKKKKGVRYPPPPPPPPPPRGPTAHAGDHNIPMTPSPNHHDHPPSPMDVEDEDLADPTWEDKLKMGAKRAEEASAMKNDHENLRKDFSIGSEGQSSSNNSKPSFQKPKHRKSQPTPSAPINNLHTQPPPVDPSHKREKTFYGFDSAPPNSTNDPHPLPDEDDETNAKRQRVANLRDDGRSFYINGAYRESVLRYTEAIGVHTDGFQMHNASGDETLAALYGNRAAALMMTGAYEGASADCHRALQCTEANATTGSLESGPAFRSKILCRMARALLKAGNIWEADKAFDSAIGSAKEALQLVAQSNAGAEETRAAEKILNQSITDATLGLSDVKRYRDALDGATKITADNANNKGMSAAADRRNSVQLLMFINSALSVSPGSMELHERKVNALASLKRWAELGNHCERLAAEMVKIDGIFTDDLAPLNPFPDIKAATSLKPDFFERNPDNAADPVALRILSPKAVCDAVMRLPNGILPLYLRSLRLEERYTEAAKAGASIEMHVNNSKHKGTRGIVPLVWLSNERDKLRRTMSWKERGDTLFRNGDYERAATKYAACLTIDGDGSQYNQNALENDDAGGRLHAVLHCNRAACLMALKRYREAVKECTASLRIHTHYMKAMLRRGRCFARIRQYEEAVAEYERYIRLVDEARKSPNSAGSSNAACTFDRPIDITDAEYLKAKQELADVKKSMSAAAANAQKQTQKQAEQQQNWYNNNFRKAAASNAARRRQEGPGRDNANARKQQWYDGQGGAAGGANQRRWDGFGGTAPKKTAAKKKDAPAGTGASAGPSANRASQNRKQPQQQQQQQQQQPPAPPSNLDNVHCHYTVLGITQTASSAEIKKAYHKMALKYHPDKNSEEGAADIFRRVKLAYEILGNDQTRISYDAERRRGGRR